MKTKCKCGLLYNRLYRVARKLKLPFVLHRSGTGKPGRGSCWVAETFYPVTGRGPLGKVSASAPTLIGALEELLMKI